MPSLRTTLLPLALCALCGVQAASAQTCSRKVDYPMTINRHQPLALVGTELMYRSGHANFDAVRAIDAAMKSDLDASIAAGCTQEVRNFIGYARLYTAGYCGTQYAESSQLYGVRPTTGGWWLIKDWYPPKVELHHFGGEIVNTYRHKNTAPVRLASKARVGDEVWVATDVWLDVSCFGNDDSIADRGEASYDWGPAPAPVVRIWLP